MTVGTTLPHKKPPLTEKSLVNPYLILSLDNLSLRPVFSNWPAITYVILFLLIEFSDRKETKVKF